MSFADLNISGSNQEIKKNNDFAFGSELNICASNGNYTLCSNPGVCDNSPNVIYIKSLDMEKPNIDNLSYYELINKEIDLHKYDDKPIQNILQIMIDVKPNAYNIEKMLLDDLDVSLNDTIFLDGKPLNFEWYRISNLKYDKNICYVCTGSQADIIKIKAMEQYFENINKKYGKHGDISYMMSKPI